MAKKPIEIGSTNSNYIIINSDRDYILKDGAAIFNGSIVTDPLADIDKIDLKVNGVVAGDSFGLNIGTVTSSGNHVTIGKTGVIDVEEEGIISTGNQAEITNNGSIFLSDVLTSIGFQSDGNQCLIVNNGYLRADTGFDIIGSDNEVINSGLLSGYPGATAVSFQSEAGDTNRFVNTGRTISSTSVDGGDGSEVVVNKGQLMGGVELGGGNDTFINSSIGGSDIRMGDGDDRVVFKGDATSSSIQADAGDDVLDLGKANTLSTSFTISGGTDDDTYIVVQNDLVLDENAAGGVDKVKSSVKFTLADEFENLTLTGNKNISGTGNSVGNIINGNAGDNKLKGMEGADILNGGAGKDTLKGGDDADAFVFNRGMDRDLVEDFIDGSDKINLANYQGIDNFGDLNGRIEQSGADTLINLIDGDRIRLDSFTATNLTGADFDF